MEFLEPAVFAECSEGGTLECGTGIPTLSFQGTFFSPQHLDFGSLEGFLATVGFI